MLRVLQGAEAAGPVAPQLGQPDERDVFAYTSKATGTTIFFRQGWQASGNMQWEWSTDKQLWIPTCHVSPAKRLSSKLRCMVSHNTAFLVNTSYAGCSCNMAPMQSTRCMFCSLCS